MSTRHSNLSLRILAGLELALLAAVILTGIKLVFTNLGFFVLYVVFAAILVLGGWLAFSGTGRRRSWGMFIAIGGVLGLLILILALARNAAWQIVMMVILCVAYAVLASLLAARYWRQQALAAGPGRDFENPWLVINPKSGDGRAMKAGIPAKAKDMGIKVHVTEAGEDIIALAEEAVRNSADVLGVSGGDGTLAAVATVAMRHNLPLVVLPGGTRCHFARDIGLDPENMPDSLRGFTGIERRVDVGVINGRTFLNNASFGIYAAIVSRPDYRNNKAGVSREVTRALVTSDAPHFPLHYRDADGNEQDHAAVIQVGVNRVATLSLTELGQRQRMDEGILHVIVIPAMNDQVAGQLAGALVPFRQAGGYQEWTATSFTITDPSDQVLAGIDGENVELDSPVEIKVKPAALRLVVPAGARQSRPVKPFSKAGAKALVDVLAGRA
jgi:diacylglycerol kinase family enzyme